MQNVQALLVLEDGTQFKGQAIGAEGHSIGEIVFNTSMTGYQEILTDPSYAEQIITLTYPHIGNTGVNERDDESVKSYAKGLIIRELSLLNSNFRSQCSLTQYLKKHNIVAIADIDTRALTNVLRRKGAQHGCIITYSQHNYQQQTQKALTYAQQFPGLSGLDLAQHVSCSAPYQWSEGSYNLKTNNFPIFEPHSQPYHVVVYDFGIKKNILRMLVDRGCSVTVLPAKTPAEQALSLKPDGIFLSNGPGDPAACHYAIKNIQTFLNADIPLFGICLGHQLLALACGAKTIKMKFGHHGGNHPVKILANNSVMITAQNHGFTVDDTTLPIELYPTHYSLFDHTLQGIHHKNKPAFGFQGHPEASPGPHDAAPLFDHFIELISQKIKGN